VCQCCVLTCQSIALISLDRDHALGARHPNRGIGSVDDHHELQEEQPPEDAVVPDVEAGHLKRNQLLTLIVSCSIGYLQVDAPNRCG
jgi:hypothetical protein